MTDRIASFTQTSQIISNNLRLQGRYAESQIQISSGFKSQNFQGIAGDTSRLLNLESDYERIAQQTENTQIALDRGEVMYSALNGILEATRQFQQDLQSTASGFGLEGPDLVNNAETYLNRIAGSLNTSLADRYLFAGSATKTQPVQLATFGGQIYTPPTPSAPDDGYYEGNNYIQTVEAADSFNIDYGVTANNPAFEKIIRALDLVISNPTDDDTLFEALRVIEEGYTETAVLQATIAQRVQTMDRQINSNVEELNLLDSQIVDIREIDAAEVTVQLKQLETQLEASYSVTTDLMQLSLVDYIR
jgi:flagellar hook-associated protein 3 FlgL